ncbi:hypothetical protein LP420_25625 [Massilia sp. B-10]|nr:hypothetical protein LP420_25625 [Massilia sp. B-10]
MTLPMGLKVRAYRTRSFATAVMIAKRSRMTWKLLGHASHENIPFVLTDDKHSMFRYCERLRSEQSIKVKAIALVDGFDDCALRLDGQAGFGF